MKCFNKLRKIRIYLNADVKSDILVQGMRIIKSKVSYNPDEGYKITDGFSLEILNF